MSTTKPQVIDLDFLLEKLFSQDELDTIPPDQLIHKLYSQTKLDLSDCHIEEISHLETMTELKSIYLQNVCNSYMFLF